MQLLRLRHAWCGLLAAKRMKRLERARRKLTRPCTAVDEGRVHGIACHRMQERFEV